MHSRLDSHAPRPRDEHPGVRKRRPRCSAVWASSVLAIAVLASTAATASAAEAIGPFNFSGQVTGSVSEPLKITENVAGVKVPAVGCTVQQSSTPEDLILFPSTKLKHNGKAVSTLQIVTSAKKYGDTEKIATDGPQVVVTLSIGKKNSEWTATSGSVEMKNKGLAGSFSVGLIPASKAPGGNPVMSGGATKPIHVSGSWSDCRPPVS
jgi:hypothetical protein